MKNKIFIKKSFATAAFASKFKCIQHFLWMKAKLDYFSCSAARAAWIVITGSAYHFWAQVTLLRWHFRNIKANWTAHSFNKYQIDFRKYTCLGFLNLNALFSKINIMLFVVCISKKLSQLRLDARLNLHL